MKARIKGTGIIVECLRLDEDNKRIYCKYINGEFAGICDRIPSDCLVELEDSFDWQSFRAEAAKDILSNALIPHALQQFDEVTVYDEDVVRIDFWIDKAVEWSDKLISKLKEKEEK